MKPLNNKKNKFQLRIINPKLNEVKPQIKRKQKPNEAKPWIRKMTVKKKKKV